MTLKKIMETLVDETQPICKKCKCCHNCSLIKSNNNEICKSCVIECRDCKKILLKYDFPTTYYIDSLCIHCYNKCVTCKKYTSLNNVIIKDDKRYCPKCIKYPDDHKIDTKYSIITKQTIKGKVFIKWKTLETKRQCTTCKKIKWCKYSKCKTCYSNNGKHKYIKDNPNPSTKKVKYILTQNDNDKYKWTPTEKTVTCHKCYNKILVDYNHDGKLACSSCKPISANDKYKYDKKKKQWIKYSSKTNCDTCQISKWMKINQITCRKCVNKIKID